MSSWRGSIFHPVYESYLKNGAFFFIGLRGLHVTLCGDKSPIVNLYLEYVFMKLFKHLFNEHGL